MYRLCNRAEFAITHCAILPKPHTISQQPMPIASRATAAVINTAKSCGSLPLQPPLQWPYQRDDKHGKGYGIITLRASDKAASVRMTAQISAASRSVRSSTGFGGLSKCTIASPNLPQA